MTPPGPSTGRERLGVGVAVAVACVLSLATMGPAVALLVIALVLSWGLWIARRDWPAPRRILPAYATAVLMLFVHMVEEYLAGFPLAFPPLVGQPPWPAVRFLAFNLAWLVVFIAAGIGLARGQRTALVVALFVAIGGGLANGAGHLVLVIIAGGYFPGAYTAPLLLLVGGVLAVRLLHRPGRLRSRMGEP